MRYLLAIAFFLCSFSSPLPLFGQGSVAHITSSGLQLPTYTFAGLPSSANGFMVYCSDCTNADPCAGSGTGAVAQRVGSTWACASGGTTFIVTTTMIAPGKVKLTSASVLTINDGCSSGNPCNILVGSTTYTFTSSATATITAGAGSGTAKIYISTSGLITVEHPTAAGVTINCTGCTQSQVTTPAFPSGAVPLYNATITAGAWTAIQDLRTFVGGGSPGQTLKRGWGHLFGDINGTTTMTASTLAPPVTIPYACAITAYYICASDSSKAAPGTVTVKFLKKAGGTAQPTASDSINTSGVSLTANTCTGRVTTLTDFTTTTVTAADQVSATPTAVGTAVYLSAQIECTI